jgi:hypothetical protein
MNNLFTSKFLTNTDDTGRFIVNSKRTGRTYYVEPIDGRGKTDWTEWGSIDLATGKMMNKPGFRKYHGAIDPKESLITPENGFSKITMLEPGMSPLAWINHIDDQYPAKS